MPSAIVNPTPTWLKPEQASVTDSSLTKALRLIGSLIGADNPTAQVLALMNPLQIGPDGGLVGAFGKLVERAQASYRGAPDLYSRLDRAVATLPDRPIPPGQVVSVAKKAGVKDEELAYRLKAFLDQQGTKPVTKAEVTAALQQKPIQVGVKTLGGPREPSSLTRVRIVRDVNAQPPYLIVNEDTGRILAGHDTLTAAEADAVDWRNVPRDGRSVDAPKFSRYQVPGGDDYRETLLTLPQKVDMSQAVASWRVVSPTERGPDGNVTARYFRVFDKENALIAYGDTPTDAMERAIKDTSGSFAQEFRSSHFDEPNILAHTRSNTRTLPSGEKGTFLEEVQSDWHQKGKAQGYSTGQYKSGVREDANVWVVYRPDGTFVDVPKRFAQNADEAMAYADRAPDLTRHHQTSTGVPDAPFKEAWPDLALKHHLMEAANDPETAWLGFTGGQTQAARYDLSKQIDTVQWVPWPAAGEGQGRLVAMKNSEPVIQKTIPESELGDYVGKEVAQKLLAQPPLAHYGGIRELSGIDLQVGGEGMHEFYDKLLPKRLEKLVKPFGGTVEQGQLGSRSREMIDAEMDAIGQQLDAGAITEDQYRIALNRAQHERTVGSIPAAELPLWFARLTPEMKARIQREGFPALLAILGAETALTTEPGAE